MLKVVQVLFTSFTGLLGEQNEKIRMFISLGKNAQRILFVSK